MTTLESKLQDLINQMQEDADRIVTTWSTVGDAMLKYQNNQNQLLGELARIFEQSLRRQAASPQPVYAQGPAPGQVAGMGPAYRPDYQPIPDYGSYAQQGQPSHYPQSGVAPQGNGGYYSPEQGYPPQPYQEPRAPQSQSQIAEVIRNLRREAQ